MEDCVGSDIARSPRPNYISAYSAIEGVVQTLTSRRGLRFTLFDSLHDQAVSCYLEDGQEELMRGVWGRRAKAKRIYWDANVFLHSEVETANVAAPLSHACKLHAAVKRPSLSVYLPADMAGLIASRAVKVRGTPALKPTGLRQVCQYFAPEGV